MKSWRTDTTLDYKEAELLNPNLCSSCGHSGKLQKHTKSGCIECGTTVKCHDSYKYVCYIIVMQHILSSIFILYFL